MTHRTFVAALLVALLFVIPTASRAEHEGKLQIVLLGDSTTEGGVPRRHYPKAAHLEDVVTQLLAAEGDLPPCRTINLGLSGDTLRRLLDSGRYEKSCAKLSGVDYVFIRYGINDFGRSKNFAEEFPQDFKELIARLRKDHPQAVLIPTTVIPYGNAVTSKKINDLVRLVAEEEKLPLFDLYPRYDAELKLQGPNMLTYRRFPVVKMPKQYLEFVKPYINVNAVEVIDNRLDAHFGHLEGWYADRHPNLAGYNVIGDETAKYLAPIIRAAKTGAKATVPTETK